MFGFQEGPPPKKSSKIRQAASASTTESVSEKIENHAPARSATTEGIVPELVVFPSLSPSLRTSKAAEICLNFSSASLSSVLVGVVLYGEPVVRLLILPPRSDRPRALRVVFSDIGRTGILFESSLAGAGQDNGCGRKSCSPTYSPGGLC